MIKSWADSKSRRFYDEGKTHKLPEYGHRDGRRLAGNPLDIQIEILVCVIGRPILTTYRTYDLFDGAPSGLAKTTI